MLYSIQLDYSIQWHSIEWPHLGRVFFGLVREIQYVCPWFGLASCSTGKTESERYQRLLAMTIWTGYVGSTLINVYGFEQGPRRTRG